ncbi:MAG: primase-helicase zinc-binding domain-containing protein, partial [Aureliella sp.]
MDSHKKRLPDFASIKYQASGKWLQLIPALSSYGPELFDSRKHPCPKCGGNDRFRAFDDFNQEGGVVCSQCHSKNNRDGFSTIQWLNGWSFPDTVRAVAEQLGLVDSTGNKPALRIVQPPPATKPVIEKPTPESQLEFQPWNDQIALMWCMKKQPITPAALNLFGARIAKYQGRVCIVLPIWGKSLGVGGPVGWIAYDALGGTLKCKDGQASKKVVFGSDTGVVGMVDRLKDRSSRKIKTEGPTDALALLSLNLDTTDAIFCNACGAIENPDKEQFSSLPSLVEGSRVVSIGDADKAGEEGVAKWANFFAATAAESRIARLPYEVIPSHGKDLRNWIAEGNGQEAFEHLVAAG